MSKEYQLLPSASCLSESLRDIGYSTETAIADLIDNSIAANADKIDIYCDITQISPVIAIVDNGCGMTLDGLLQAMRHGSTNPLQKRSDTDLGRFGLGLKTSSFSQCRRLTVISKRDGELCGAEWDLDIIDRKDDWLISILDNSEIKAQPYVDTLGKTGTIVIWRKLDRFLENIEGAKRDIIVNEKLDIVGNHLSLVFHRFLDGEFKGKKLSIYINKHKIKPFDPFCQANQSTQLMPHEIIRINGHRIRIQPYILPHHSKLSAEEIDFYKSRSDFMSNQGAYIYRNGRLMAWGDWFRLIPKGELSKLARIQIDFPNSLDEKWTIDIKKSRARPPVEVRDRLREIIDEISEASAKVYKGKGQKLYHEEVLPLWDRYATDTQTKYIINNQHPLVKSIFQDLEKRHHKKFALLLESLGASLPVEMIYSDYSIKPQETNLIIYSDQEILHKLKILKDAVFDKDLGTTLEFKELVRSTKMFVGREEIIDKFIMEEFDA